jgi:rod shape-determining protein MreD
MRLLKPVFFIALLLVFQNVVFSRLNLFGISPDLILIAVIGMTVLADARQALGFAIVASLAQDLLSVYYFNTFFNLALCLIILLIKERFEGEHQQLAIWLVLAFSPLQIIVQTLVSLIAFKSAPAGWLLAQKIVLLTLYNLLLMPIILGLLEKIGLKNEE